MAELVILPAVCCFAFLAMLGMAYVLYRMGTTEERKRETREEP